jgi:YesN/AraC family two-component response regulator
VDDERMVLRALRRLVLSRHPDWEVLCARSASAALGLLIDHGPIDVMVTDLSMPDVDGVALLGIVKERYPQMVRVVHSAHIESFVPQLLGDLCHEMLGKPAGATELVGTLEVASGSSKKALVAG